MFTFAKNQRHVSNCLFTYGEMPEHINEKSPPVKKPFSTIQSYPFMHTVSEFVSNFLQATYILISLIWFYQRKFTQPSNKHSTAVRKLCDMHE